jgi:hypothetical protein
MLEMSGFSDPRRAEMDVSQLATVIKRPDVHQRIVGSYNGAYSIGVTSLPTGQPALLVRVEGEPTGIPYKIEVDGQEIPVVARGGFRPPEKQDH